MATKKGSSSTSGSLLELVLIVAVALGLALGIQAFLVKPYRIPTSRWSRRCRSASACWSTASARASRDPDVGDIVVFHPPAGAEQDNMCGAGQPPAGQACDKPTPERADVNFIKRVVAGPGDQLAIDDGHVSSTASARRSRSPSPAAAARDATSRPRSRFRPTTTS